MCACARASASLCDHLFSYFLCFRTEISVHSRVRMSEFDFHTRKMSLYNVAVIHTT